MAKLNYNNFIKPLKEDLDENIVQHARISENAIIDIINPVTGTLDQIKITHKPYISDDIVKVEYTIDTQGIDVANGIREETLTVSIDTLEDLYEWILIED